MSDRDNQMKHDLNSNIEGSMYAKVNAGSNAKYDTHEYKLKEKNVDSLNVTASFYMLGFLISLIFVLIGTFLLKDIYFNGNVDQLLPTILLIISSVTIGFSFSSVLIKRIVKSK